MPWIFWLFHQNWKMLSKHCCACMWVIYGLDRRLFYGSEIWSFAMRLPLIFARHRRRRGWFCLFFLSIEKCNDVYFVVIGVASERSAQQRRLAMNQMNQYSSSRSYIFRAPRDFPCAEKGPKWPLCPVPVWEKISTFSSQVYWARKIGYSD